MRTLSPWSVVLALLCCGCPPIETKVPSSTVIDVPGESILGASPLSPSDVFPTDLIGDALAQSIERSFDTSGYDKGAVKSLKLTLLTLTVLEPEEGGQQVRDLSFLESLAVSLGAPEEEPLLVAESADGAFDDDPIVYDMPLTDAELAPAFKSADTLDMSAEVIPGDTPRFATQVQIDSELTVQIGF